MCDLYTKEINGVKCWLRPNTSDEVVFEDNLIRAPVTKHLKVEVGQKWLDLGGYIGTFALYIYSQGGRTVSVEANPANAEMYRKNMNENCEEPWHWDLLEGAVMCYAPESGETTLFVMPEIGKRRRNHAASTMFNRWKTEYPSITCKAFRFSQVVDWAHNILGNDGDWNLKIDIEGAEIEILMNSDLSPFNQIYWEYHFQANCNPNVPKAITKRLENMGFEVFWSRKLLDRVPKFWHEMTMMGWARKRAA